MNKIICNKTYNLCSIISKIIKDTVEQEKNNINYHYSKKTDIYDGIAYDFLYTQKDVTQEMVSAEISLNKNQTITRQSLINRSKNLSYDFYKKLQGNVQSVLNVFHKNISNSEEDKVIDYKDLTNIYSSNVINNENDIVLIDGTFVNLYDIKHPKKYVTKCILVVYNITQNRCISLFIKNNDNSYRKELSLCYEFFANHKLAKNTIIVADSYYYSKKLHDIFIRNEYKFVIKLKTIHPVLNSYKSYYNKLIIDKEENIDNFNLYDHVINYDNKKVRVVSYQVNKEVYHIATNIYDRRKYKINYFKNTYKLRWDVEVYIKQIKESLCIDLLNNHKVEVIDKRIIVSEIVSMIYKTMVNIYSSNTEDSTLVINEKLFIKYFYQYLLDIIYGKTVESKLTKILTQTTRFIRVSTTVRYFIRYSIKPYTKWHYKFKFNNKT